MKSARQAKAVCFIIALIIAFSCPVQAYPTRAQHDKVLERMLFVRNYPKRVLGDREQNYIICMKYAVALAIDQFNGTDEGLYKFLGEHGIKGIPGEFSDIDYSSDFSSGEKVVAKTHRRVTHQGWDRTFQNKKANEFWGKRRKLLLGTVDSIFDFGLFSSSTFPAPKCNALCGIMYYSHILGDYDEAKKATGTFNIMIPLAGSKDREKYEIIGQLRMHLDVLFQDQKDSLDYKMLLSEMDDIDRRARKLVNSIGGVDSDEEFSEYHQCAVDLLNLMIEYIPGLLKNEKFFADVFYPENMLNALS